MHEVTGLARLIEDKLASRSRPFTASRFSNPTPSTLPALLPNPNSRNSTPPTQSQSTTTTASSSTRTATQPSSKPLPFHKLSPEAIQQRRREGLCFRCPARYSPGHVCSPPQFLFIVDQDDTEEFSPPPDLPPPELMSLSPAAFFGMSSPPTLRLTGYILGKPVTVLIDCGSTHNIIQQRVAALLPLSQVPLQPFPVMVGNGQYIYCEGHCPSVPVQLHNSNFDIPFFKFQIHGADIVLGIAWLASLGRISADFSIPEISFTIDSVTTTLTCNNPPHPTSQPPNPTGFDHHAMASFHQLTTPNPPTLHCSSPPPPDPHLQSLLSTFP